MTRECIIGLMSVEAVDPRKSFREILGNLPRQFPDFPEVSDMVSEILGKIDNEEVRIYVSGLVHDLRVSPLCHGKRLRVSPLCHDEHLAVFIPEGFSRSWSGERLQRKMVSMLFDALIETRHISGPDLYRFKDLEKQVLLQE